MDSDNTATTPCLAWKASYPLAPRSCTILPSPGTEESRGGGSLPSVVASLTAAALWGPVLPMPADKEVSQPMVTVMGRDTSHRAQPHCAYPYPSSRG